MNKKYKVWECKILVPEDIELPLGFDSPPRSAAIKAIERVGIPVLACSSGWGGVLTKEEQEFYENNVVDPRDIYYAGFIEEQEGGNN